MSSDIISYGSVAISKNSSTTLVVYPRLQGSLLTRKEARMLGKALIRMSRELEEVTHIKPEKKKRKKRRRRHAKNK